jgi:hypothetical protein
MRRHTQYRSVCLMATRQGNDGSSWVCAGRGNQSYVIQERVIR